MELWSPVFGERDVGPLEADLTIQRGGEPVGERMKVAGRVLDGEGRPVRRQLVEVWQANAAGRYVHQRDQHPAPLDPNFVGMGRCLTDDDGGYAFTTIKPGPYPWRNHDNAWRPAHIHFSLFGTDFTQRLVTQMYFPGDPLFALDPIYQSIVDPRARARLVATYDHDLTEAEWCTGYRWDIVLTGSAATPLRRRSDAPRPRPSGRSSPSASSTTAAPRSSRPARPGAIRLHGRVLDGAGDPVPDALVELWQADADGLVVAAVRLAAPRRLHLHRLGPRRHRPHGHLLLHDRGAGRGPASPIDLGPAVLRPHGVRSRLARPALHPRVPPGPSPRPAARLAGRRPAGDAARRADDHGFVFDIRLQADDQGDGETVFLSYPGAPD